MSGEPAARRREVGTLDLVVLGVAVTAFGMAFGATAVSQGLDPLKVIILSIVAHAGTAQLGAIAVLAAGGSPVAALATGMLITARFIPLGLMVTRRFPPSLRTRLLATHVLTEPAGALAITARTDAEGRTIYWRVGLTLLCVWIVGSGIGAFGGQFVTDIRALGLDVALPALLAGVIVPMLRERTMRLAAAAAAVVAIALHTVLPAGAPILIAAASGFLVARLVEGPSGPRIDPVG